MAVRTTAAQVKAILGNDPQYHYDGSTDLTPFIEAASALVDDLNDCAADRNITLGATRLELIERWVAAHCYAQMDLIQQSAGNKSASGTFMGTTAEGLKSTRYGQYALALDRSGCLAGTQNRAYARWLGKPPSEQTEYVDRD